ncbi:MAG: LacI family DNA-binding transcriptional regulator [Chloroflexota bacterium]|nr:LacI family DNA-binding transcriptional regulator [Chloroflexota bacterium]
MGETKNDNQRPYPSTGRAPGRPRRASGTQRSITLQTIADRMGVSRSTVSNAYGRPDQLAPALREQILRVASDLGYPGPHAVARTLRRGRVGAIGLLLTEALTYAFRDPAAVLFLEGVAEVLQATDVGLLLVPAQPGHAFDPAGIQGAVVDGFLVYSVSDGHPALEEVMRRRVPTVIVDQPRLPNAALVTIDDEDAAYTAARHLLDLGHTRFAILSDRLSVGSLQPGVRVGNRKESGFLVTRLRLRGYRRALEEAGVEWGPVPIAECFPNTPDIGREAIAHIVELDPRPTALLCITDQIALGALLGAADRELFVPDDLSIVGFDDIPAAATAQPALTTIRQPLLEKGRVAAQMLTGNDRSAVRLVQLGTQLVPRESSGPAPSD